MMRELNEKNSIGIILALFVFAMNLKIMAPTITSGDSAELSTAQTVLGIAHSPGYPLFVLTGKIFRTLAPFGSAAYRTNLISAVLSGLCALTCYGIVMAWSGSCLLSICSTLFMMWVPVIRDQFVSTEVFALNFTFLLGLILLAELFEDGNFKPVYLASFFIGLGMGNQHTLVLMIPSLVILFLWDYGVEGRNAIPIILFFFLLGLSIYLFLPIRASRMPYLSWEDPRTWERFWGVVSRARYGTFQLAQGERPHISLNLMWYKTLFFITELSHQISWVGAVLCAALSVRALISGSKRKTVYFMSLFLILSGPVFLSLSNVDTEGSSREIVLRFLPMSFLALFMLSFLGASQLNSKPARLLVSLIFLAWVWRAAPVHSQRENLLVYDMGESLLKTLPNRAILFADRADEAEFSLAYLLYSEGRKKGLEFIDCNAGVTPSIYGEDYYKIWGKPRLEIRQIKENELIENAQGPVYYATVDPGMIAIPRTAQGLLFQAKPVPGKENTNISPFRKGGLRGICPIPWDEFYVLRSGLLEPGFRGISILTSCEQLMGKYFLDTDQFEKSDRCFRLLTLSSPQDVWSHSVAIWYLNKGRFDLSEKYFQKALDSGLEKDKVLCNLGALYEKEGRMTAAEESYKRALAANPDNVQAHYNLGVLYWKEGHWDRVVNEFKDVLRINPQYPEARRFLEIAIRRQEGR